MPPKKQPRMDYRQAPDSDDDDIIETKKIVERVAPEEEENTLKVVMNAFRRRSDQPAQVDFEYFPEIERSRLVQNTFLEIRNAALFIWYHHRARECTPDDVQFRLNPPYDTDFEMVKKVVHYLTREGMINYGRFVPKTMRVELIPKEKRPVLVIGAGAAGIAAAMQLIRFGFSVIILEAREKVGGRVQSISCENGFFEAGCDTLRNMSNSPIATLLHQIPVNHVEIDEHAHIFKDGRDSEPKTKLIGGLYKTMRKGLASFSHTKPKRTADGLYKSRQNIYEDMYNMIERNTLVNYHNYAKTNADLSKKREDHARKMKHHRNLALLGERRLQNTPRSDKLQCKSLRVDIRRAMERFHFETKEYEATEAQLTEHLKNRSCKQYMLPDDYRNFNYFLGHEELLAGAQLEKIQFSVNTNELESDGIIVRVEEGLQALFEKMVAEAKIEVRHGANVLEIDTNTENHVRLKIQYPDRTVQMRVPCVVSTIPLGVLKKSLKNDPEAPAFFPRFPRRKAEAIRKMGNGKINKVILEFEKPFWNNNHAVHFGLINKQIPERGLMIAWSSMPGSSIMTTYYVGENSLHDLPDAELVAKAMANLKKIFPDCPEAPKKAYCTRWHTDQFACGTGSFMGLQTEARHFNDIAEPLKCKDSQNRLYFAGEHTSATHYGSLDGAWLSGLRAATRVANDHIGKAMEERKAVPPPIVRLPIVRVPLPPGVNRRVAALRVE
uniref:SWIRM domain-containing protein n=1 Tax=Caenorhabditis tropicalis TaxID=1561998 RepID=A0A1I7T0D0_9PELO